MGKYTPGPWHWSQGWMENENDEYLEVNSVDAPLTRPYDLMAGEKTLVCTGSGEYTTPSVDDARLIQYAPDMYELLQSIYICLPRIEDRNRLMELFIKVRGCPYGE